MFEDVKKKIAIRVLQEEQKKIQKAYREELSSGERQEREEDYKTVVNALGYLQFVNYCEKLRMESSVPFLPNDKVLRGGGVQRFVKNELEKLDENGTMEDKNS